MLPRVHGPMPEIVYLNTAGGLTGGDVMQFELELAAGARAVATTQTAERAYASPGGRAQLSLTAEVAAGAALDWLPQETILFDRSALKRRTAINLHGDARLLMAEMVVLGRAAHGETLTDVDFQDHRVVTRDGRPVYVEALRLTPEILGRANSRGGLGGARAFATLALIAPGAEDAVGPMRAALAGLGISAAASGWDGKCVARFLSADIAALRRALAATITTLRNAPLPRVWQI